jgi:hypothetical protein
MFTISPYRGGDEFEICIWYIEAYGTKRGKKINILSSIFVCFLLFIVSCAERCEKPV